MQWNDVMQKAVKLITSNEAKEFCSSNPLEAYQLVDVRQPGEYQNGHLPGSILHPLDQLIGGNLGELQKDKPTLVYCHAGGRSAAAAQWMHENGFSEVMDIQGGFSVWNGLAASGPVEHNLNLIGPDAQFGDALQMSYAMEDGLQKFYQILAKEVEAEQFKELFARLASFEDHHKNNLAAKGDITEGDSKYADIMEGGFSVETLAKQVVPRMTSVEEVFSLSMAIEAQAYDFYSRLSKQAKVEESAQLFTEMANEEKGHLSLLAQEMDKLLATA